MKKDNAMINAMNKSMNNTEKFELEYRIFIPVLFLLTIGTVMIYSSSSIYALEKYQDGSIFLWKHIVRVILGLFAMFIVARIDYNFFKKTARLGLLIAYALLFYILIAGKITNGALRWISIASYTFQPSEIAKFALILYMADALTRKQDKINSFFDGFFPLVITLSIGIVLIIFEPDFSTAMMITAIILGMMFAGRVKIWHMLGTGLAAIPIILMAVIMTPYRMQRIITHLNPGKDPMGAGYQIKQSLISLGNGGLLGQGLGESKQKFLYLPEPHTDFIFAILGEEGGFISVLIVLTLFLYIMYRGFKVAAKAPNNFGFILGVGIVLSLGLYAFINAGVVCGLLPTTGLPMPFISYGGSSLLVNLIGVGILLNIASQSKTGANSHNPYEAPEIKVTAPERRKAKAAV